MDQNVLNFDHAKCAQRRRIAARRDGVNAVPFRFLRSDAPKSGRVISTMGWLPANEKQALERINSLRPDPSAPPLTPDDVFIHYAEAANSNYVDCYCLFMGEQTLKNIASDAEAGFAFMNSHRTGGLSSPAELPFGRAFAGRYEMADGGGDGGPARRAVIGIYMLRGAHPNGANGPSTDDLNAQISAGTIFDVSVGLFGGEEICDVCGNGLFDRDPTSGDYICPHIPGTRVGMSPEDVTAQQGRGVTDGVATYTYEDAHCGETSAVYDGAVPGAGFRKAMNFSRSLSAVDAATVNAAFERFFGSAEETTMTVQNRDTNAPKQLAVKPGDPAGAGDEAAMANGFFALVRKFFSDQSAPAQVDASKETDLRAQLEDERTKRVDAEVANVLSKNRKKFNTTSKERFTRLLTAATLSPAELTKTLAAELTALADELPIPVVETRADMKSGEGATKAADTLARNAAQMSISGEDEAAAERISLDARVRTYLTDKKMPFSAQNYTQALRAVLVADAVVDATSTSAA